MSYDSLRHAPLTSVRSICASAVRNLWEEEGIMKGRWPWKGSTLRPSCAPIQPQADDLGKTSLHLSLGVRILNDRSYQLWGLENRTQSTVLSSLPPENPHSHYLPLTCTTLHGSQWHGDKAKLFTLSRLESPGSVAPLRIYMHWGPLAVTPSPASSHYLWNRDPAHERRLHWRQRPTAWRHQQTRH
jgi:hypothetical protein